MQSVNRLMNEASFNQVQRRCPGLGAVTRRVTGCSMTLWQLAYLYDPVPGRG